MRKMNVVLLALVVVCALTGAAFAAPWKLATIRPVGSAVDIDVRAFAEEVKKGTDGRIDIQIYPANQLGDYTVVQERISVGSVEMGIMTMAWGVDKRLSSFSTPYLVKDWATAKKNYSTGSAYTKWCENIMKKQDIKILAYWPVYFGGIALMKVPAEPANVHAKQNIKVRVPGMKQWEAIAEAFGYLATPLPFAEFFTAAQTGMVEGMFGAGAENHYVNFKDNIKCYIAANTHFECWPLTVNMELYNSLSDADRAVLDKAAANLEARRWVAAVDETASYEKKMADVGVKIVTLTPEQQAEFAEVGRKACWPVMEGVLGKKNYDELMKVLVLD